MNRKTQRQDTSHCVAGELSQHDSRSTFGSRPGRKADKGFSLVEIIIGLLVLSILFFVVQTLMVSSQRGSMRGREASMHLYTEVVLSQIMERDFRSILPYEIHSTKGPVGGPISYAPNKNAATEILFWRLSATGVEQIRYVYDAPKKEIRREVVDSHGQAIRVSRFGTGMVTKFLMTDTTGKATVFRMNIAMKGKERKTEIERIFAHGFKHQQFSQHWVFHFP